MKGSGNQRRRADDSLLQLAGWSEGSYGDQFDGSVIINVSVAADNGHSSQTLVDFRSITRISLDREPLDASDFAAGEFSLGFCESDLALEYLDILETTSHDAHRLTLVRPRHVTEVVISINPGSQDFTLAADWLGAEPDNRPPFRIGTLRIEAGGAQAPAGEKGSRIRLSGADFEVEELQIESRGDDFRVELDAGRTLSVGSTTAMRFIGSPGYDNAGKPVPARLCIKTQASGILQIGDSSDTEEIAESSLADQAAPLLVLEAGARAEAVRGTCRLHAAEQSVVAGCPDEPVTVTSVVTVDNAELQNVDLCRMPLGDLRKLRQVHRLQPGFTICPDRSERLRMARNRYQAQPHVSAWATLKEKPRILGLLGLIPVGLFRSARRLGRFLVRLVRIARATTLAGSACDIAQSSNPGETPETTAARWRVIAEIVRDRNSMATHRIQASRIALDCRRRNAHGTEKRVLWIARLLGYGCSLVRPLVVGGASALIFALAIGYTGSWDFGLSFSWVRVGDWLKTALEVFAMPATTLREGTGRSGHLKETIGNQWEASALLVAATAAGTICLATWLFALSRYLRSPNLAEPGA